MALTTSCSNEEADLFDQSAAERLNASSEKYTNVLTSGSGKWALEYYPMPSTDKIKGKGYLMAVDFKKSHEVTVGMNNLFTGNKYREASSIWQVITDNGPVLSFNTWNDNLHIFSSPEKVLKDDDIKVGEGLEGDYEFVITEVGENNSTVTLKGKKRGAYDRLLALPDTTSLQSYVEMVNAFNERMASSTAPNSLYLLNQADTFQVDSAATGMFYIFPKGKDAVSTQTLHPFLFSVHEGSYWLRLRDEYKFKADGKSFQELRYDPSTDRFVSPTDPGIMLIGPDPVWFFQKQISSGKRYLLSKSSAFSASAQPLMDKMVAERFTAKNTAFTFNSLYLSQDASGKYLLSVTYRNNRGASTVFKIEYDGTLTEKGIALSNPVLSDSAQEPLYSRLTALQAFVAKLAGEFVASESLTRFNLVSIKLTSATDADYWFTISQN